jgi:hypothetical protein
LVVVKLGKILFHQAVLALENRKERLQRSALGGIASSEGRG